MVCLEDVTHVIFQELDPVQFKAMFGCRWGNLG
jgi:hypothetical protein